MYPSTKARRPIPIRAKEAMQCGEVMSKYDLAERIGCHPKNAMRVLVQMHREDKLLHICRWEREHGSPLPYYKWGQRWDARQPKPLTKAETKRIARKDPRVREIEAAKKRANRSIGRHVKLGLFGV